MAILTKNPVTKGTPSEFTLNKTDLAELTAVSGDAYYSDSANWKTVVMSFKSSLSNQTEILTFDATEASPTANFSVSNFARGNFLVTGIKIFDFDHGFFSVQRADLPIEDFDVILDAPAGPPVAPVLNSVTDFGSGSALVSWGAVAGADEYNVYAGTSSGSYDPAKTLVTSSTSVAFNGLTAGIWYFAVTTVADRDESGYSNEISFEIVIATLDAPTNVQGSSPSAGTINLSWDAVTDAEQYNIYRDGVFWGVVNSPDLSYEETGADPGTYMYTVAAAKDSGLTVGPQSDAVEIVVA